jgi:hypothetical protein
MNAGENNPERRPRDFEGLVREIQQNLRPGGPPVDWAAIHLYVAGDLDDGDSRNVRGRIVTWEAWNRAYWETMQLLESTDGVAGGDPEKESQATPPGESVDALRPVASTPAYGRWAMLAVAATVLIGVGLGIWIASRDWDGRIVAQLDDPFGRITKNRRGEIHGLESFPERLRGPVGEMLRTESVRVPVEPGTTRAARHGSSRSMYLRPVGTAVKSDRPLLEWRPRGKDMTYRVAIYRAGQSEPIAKSEDLKEPRWAPSTSLERGLEYAWEVEVIRDGRAFRSDEDRPRFKVLNTASLARLEEDERGAKGSHLVLALVYLKAGLLDDAQRELQSLKEGQGGADIVARLLESLEQQR